MCVFIVRIGNSLNSFCRFLKDSEIWITLTFRVNIRVERFWTFCRKSLWQESYSKHSGPNRQNLKYFWIWWKFRFVDDFLKNKCLYKKLSFCSQLLKNTKIHINSPILVLKVSLLVIESEKWNFKYILLME
jgi:hypothetical protein